LAGGQEKISEGQKKKEFSKKGGTKKWGVTEKNMVRQGEKKRGRG